MAFAHLHVHTEFSALDGMIRVKEAFNIARDMGQSSLAITDHGNLAAAWSAQQAADTAGVKFIAGCELYLAIGSRAARGELLVPAGDNSADEGSERDDDKPVATATKDMKTRRYMHLTVLAYNHAGWRNLVQLNNKAQESVFSKPRIDFDLLAEHGEGIIVLTGCLGGPLIGPLSRQTHWLNAAETIPTEYAAAAAARLITDLRQLIESDPYGVDEARATLEARNVSAAEQARVADLPFGAVQWSNSQVSDLAVEIDERRRQDLAFYSTEQGLAHLRARLYDDRRTELLGLAATEYQAARENLQAIIDAVGAQNTFVELMEHGNAEESRVLPTAVELAREFGVGIVATNDAHHSREADAEAHRAWLLVQSQSTFANPKFEFHGDGYWLRTEEQMRALRPEPWWQEACDTSAVIADRCETRTLPAARNLMPRFPTPEGFASNRAYLYHLLRDGAARIFGGIDTALRDRVMAEMEVIDSAGMVDYFLVVHDLISWARSTRAFKPGGPEKKPIMVGPGRGSAGGSMVAYLLGITQINPIRYGLLFERFYETGRSEPPDIDIDFPQGRRQEVIQYLRDRWGSENVSSIGSAVIERTKKAINDAARVIGAGSTAAAMNKLVPDVGAKPMRITELLEEGNPATGEYRRFYDGDDVVRRVHGIAESFEDIVSGFSIHASGVIVSSEPLEQIVPLRKEKGVWVLQWTGTEAEQFGLLKVDVLGLRNLDIIDRAVEYIENTTGELVNPLTLPDPDGGGHGADADRVAAAWKLIAEGRTAGIFQMEGAKMTELAMQVAPRRLDEESAIVALYRPGPMGMGAHTSYANRKRGLEPADYRVFTTDATEERELAKVLGETFGLIVYQEQVMALGTVMAGFDAVGRSKLRKAVSKKKKADLEAIQPLFFELATTELRDADGNVTSIAFSPVTVQAVWDTLLVFAEYAFNKAHSATYGYLAYMTAFYKANWPAAYAAANLAVTDKKEKRVQVLGSLRDEGIEVLPPDVNSPSAYTSPAGGNAIRFGLNEVTDLGAVGKLIADERVNGPFTSLRDVYVRVKKPDESGSALGAAQMKALINSGALDAFGPRLGHMTVVGALPSMEIDIPDMNWGALETSARQRQSLHTPLGEHPLVALHSKLKDISIKSVTGDSRLNAKPTSVAKLPNTDGDMVYVLAVLASWTERPYSKGRLANITLEGSNASVPGTIWDHPLTEIKSSGVTPEVGDIVLVNARVRFRVIPADPEDPGAEEMNVKELSVMSMSVVDINDPPTGGLPRSPFPRLDLTRRGALAPAATVPASLGPSVEAEAPAVPTAFAHTLEPFDGPLVFDPQFDAQPATVATVAPAPETTVAAAAAAAEAPNPPATRDLAAVGELIEADRARGGAGVIPHQPVHTVAELVPAGPQQLPAGEWAVVVSASPSTNVQHSYSVYSARDVGHGLVEALGDFQMGSQSRNRELAKHIQVALSESPISGRAYALLLRGDTPVFQIEVGT